MAKAYKDFLSRTSSNALRRNIELGLEEIQARISWRERDETKLISWLAEV